MKNWIESNRDFSVFQRFARATRGIMGHSSFSKHLKPLIEKMSAHILKSAESSEAIDIAFVIDTTISMKPYIAEVKENLVQFLEYFKEKAKKNTRVAILEYRDNDLFFDSESFLHRVNTEFTSNFGLVQRSIERLETKGGGDYPVDGEEKMIFQ